MVKEKTFREDLYYRLNVMRIRIPSLRDRLDDVPELVDFMLQRISKEGSAKVVHVSKEAMQVLSRYDWPGNVRELENTVQRSVVIAQGDTILKKDLPAEILAAVEGRVEHTPATEPSDEKESSGSLDTVPGASLSELSHEEIMDLLYEKLREKYDKGLLQELERELTVRVLKETKGNQVRTSSILGITRTTLRKRIETYGLGDS